MSQSVGPSTRGETPCTDDRSIGCQLATLYPTHAAFVTKWDAATTALVGKGYLTPADARTLDKVAAQSSVGRLTRLARRRAPLPRPALTTVPPGPAVDRRWEVAHIRYETLLYEEDEGVATVTLNRPQVHNAFDLVMEAELRELWQRLKTADGVRCVVLTGAGEKAFCTGMDRAGVPTEESDYDFHPLTYEDPGQRIGPRSQGLWKPIIAAVNGMACGGAFYLLGEVDFIVAADHATFFDPHVTYGMPAVFEPALMAQKMPFGEVMRMTLMGARERISAQRAERMGLVSQVVAGPELREVTTSLARTIASYPPDAVQASLRTVWASRELSPGQMVELGNLFLNMATTSDTLRDSQKTFEARKPDPPTIR